MPTCEAKKDPYHPQKNICPRAQAIARGATGLPPCLYPELAEGIEYPSSHEANLAGVTLRNNCFRWQKTEK